MEVKTPLKTAFKAATGTAVLVGAAAIAAHFMEPIEGEKFRSYRDGGGIWTICRGHTEGVTENMVADDNQCQTWYAQDISKAEVVYDRAVKSNLPNNTKAAAISFIFNTGSGNFQSSTLLKKLKAGDRVGACAQFVRWKLQDAPRGSGYDMADGIKDGKANCFLDVNAKFCGGLKTRRLKETSLCLDNANYQSYTWVNGNYFTGVKK